MSEVIKPDVYKDESNLNSLKLLRFITSGILESAYEVAVCCSLLSHRNSKTGLTRPFISSIAKEACCSKSQVKRVIKDLSDRDFLIHVPQFYNNEKTASLYFFTFDIEFLYQMAENNIDNWEHPIHDDYVWLGQIKEVRKDYFDKFN